MNSIIQYGKKYIFKDIDKIYTFFKFECILKKRCQFSQVYSLFSLRLGSGYSVLGCFFHSVSLYLYTSIFLFFSLFLCECDPFGVVATGITLVGPPGGPRTDSRRATRTPEGVRSCARADVLLSFDTLDDTPVMLRIDYTVYSFARERNRMTKKHRILSLYSNVAWILHFYFCFYYVLCNTLFQMYVLHVLHIFTNFKFTA